MKTYKPIPDSHISQACEGAIKLAIDENEPVEMTFNGVTVTASPTSEVDALEKEIEQALRANYETWKASPEGQLAESYRAQEVLRKQESVDGLIEKLPEAIAGGLDDLLNWIGLFTIVADDVDVEFNKSHVYDLLKGAGYDRRFGDGFSDDWFTKSRRGRWIVGRTMECLLIGLPPEPIAVRFINEYKEMTE